MQPALLYAFIYLVSLVLPIFFIFPLFTIWCKTDSTVAALTSGNTSMISAFEIGMRLFRTIASILADFVILFP